jgi:uncharacterized membrane protein
MTTREIIIAIPLVFFTVALGVLPTPFLLAWMSPSVDEMVKSVLQAKTVITVTSQNTELDKSTNPVVVPRAIETADR